VEVIVELSRLGGVALSVGTIAWVVHFTSGLSRMLVSIPAWRHLDTVPILPIEGAGRDSGDDVPSDAGREAEELGVGQMLATPAGPRLHAAE
jgi:hypothetical protein